MFYEIVRALIQKIFQDKILFALVIIGLLAIFVGGFGGGNDRVMPSARQQRNGMTARTLAQEQENEQKQEEKAPQQKAAPAPAASELTPKLAQDFVTWWISLAMDYKPQTAQASHQTALSWMTPDAAQSFQGAFWTPELANGVASGGIAASFTAVDVKPIARNQDGSVVVRVKGHLVIQRSVQSVDTDYLVRRESNGLRVAGMYNRAVAAPGVY